MAALTTLSAGDDEEDEAEDEEEDDDDESLDEDSEAKCGNIKSYNLKTTLKGQFSHEC